jgi:hypothetical protein
LSQSGVSTIAKGRLSNVGRARAEAECGRGLERNVIEPAVERSGSL